MKHVKQRIKLLQKAILALFEIATGRRTLNIASKILTFIIVDSWRYLNFVIFTYKFDGKKANNNYKDFQ